MTKKITEVLEKPQETIEISVFVDKKTKELIDDVKAAMLKGKLRKEADEFIFELTNPTFEVLSAGMSSMFTTGGKLDLMGAGAAVFDSCYLGNQGELIDIMNFPALYAGLCQKCGDLVNSAYTEFKKK